MSIKNKIFSATLLLVGLTVSSNAALAGNGPTSQERHMESLARAGYQCETMSERGGVGKQYTSIHYVRIWIQCSRPIAAYYSGTLLHSFAVRGDYVTGATETIIPYDYGWSWNQPSPYLYLYNAPTGEVSVSLDSDLDVFSPARSFTNTNTWNLQSSAGNLSLEGDSVESLFYRLAIDDITLSRYGQNFSSKADLIDYLTDSDFLDKMGFVGVEKTNSLATIVADIKSASVASFYYLTVLDDASVANISKVTVEPQPQQVIRSYFAVYPSAVPVKTTGDFKFPAATEVSSGFVVKETGELLLTPDTFVSFK